MTEFIVVVEPEGRMIRAFKGETLLEAFNHSGVGIRSECGGQGVCGTCRVFIEDMEVAGDLTEGEKRLLSEEELDQGLRLACQARVGGDLTVMIPRESRLRQRRIQVEGVGGFFEVTPAILKIVAEPSHPSLAHPQSSCERLTHSIEGDYGLGLLTVGYEALKRLPEAIEASEKFVTATVWEEREIIDIEVGETERDAYGFAVDVGTSKIVGQMVSLVDGRVLATKSMENPQIMYGEDVISRISLCSNEFEGLEALKSCVLDGVNRLISLALQSGNVSERHVYEVTVVGNSAMHHILLGIQPRTLAVAPYAPVVKAPLNLKAREVGIHVNQAGNLHLLPLVAGFVGSDNVADILSTGVHKSELMTLLIDIGTNTEVNLGDSSGILCCSCASGPAFEGAHIHDGIKAVRGAIERVDIDQEDYSVNLQVVEGGKPVGICGSAMIDILAEMLKCNLIDSTGRINPQAPTDRIRRRGGLMEFVVAWSDETDREEDIVITQGDVRELQLAKAAIYSGCSLLMKRRGVTARDIQRVFLAGAFGSYIDPDNARTIGIIPDVRLEDVNFVGNTALSGARMALLSRDVRREAVELRQKLTYVELGAEPGFNEELISATYIPHRDSALFPSAKLGL